MSKQSTAKRKPPRIGRPPLSEYGLVRRSRKVLASFTPDEYALLESAAAREQLTVAELVAQRALADS